MSNQMASKMWDEIAYPQVSTVAPFKFLLWVSNFMQCFIMIKSITHAGKKLIHVDEYDPS